MCNERNCVFGFRGPLGLIGEDNNAVGFIVEFNFGDVSVGGEGDLERGEDDKDGEDEEGEDEEDKEEEVDDTGGTLIGGLGNGRADRSGEMGEKCDSVGDDDGEDDFGIILGEDDCVDNVCGENDLEEDVCGEGGDAGEGEDDEDD